MTLTDPDSGNISWAVVEVSGLVDGPNNTVEYIFSNLSLPIAENRSTTDGLGQYLKLTGIESIAEYRRYIRSLRYVNWKDEPTPGLRTVRIYVVDEEGAQSNTALTNITIQPVNDHAPVFSRPEYVGFVFEHSFIGTPVNITVIATDGDLFGDDQLRFSIDGPFNVNAVTGIVTTGVALDREAVNGSRYSLEITVEDQRGEAGSLSGVATVTVVVGDINDQTPVFSRDQYSLIIRENIPVGYSFYRVAASDSDEGTNAEISFRLEMVGSGLPDPFEISPSGNLSTTRSLDYENGDVSFNLTVVATDSGTPSSLSSSTTISITVKDVNDNAPQFELSSYNTSVSENTPVNVTVITVWATDKDSDDNSRLRFELLGANITFYLTQTGPSSAEIRVAGKLDYEVLKTYDFVVVVTDHGVPELSSTAAVHVDVADSNDNPPKLTADQLLVQYPEGSGVVPVGAVAGIQLSDVDDNSQFYMENATVTLTGAIDVDEIIGIEMPSTVVRTGEEFNLLLMCSLSHLFCRLQLMTSSLYSSGALRSSLSSPGYK